MMRRALSFVFAVFCLAVVLAEALPNVKVVHTYQALTLLNVSYESNNSKLINLFSGQWGEPLADIQPQKKTQLVAQVSKPAQNLRVQEHSFALPAHSLAWLGSWLKPFSEFTRNKNLSLKLENQKAALSLENPHSAVMFSVVD